MRSRVFNDLVGGIEYSSTVIGVAFCSDGAIVKTLLMR